MSADKSPLSFALVGHTNAGKTSLMRTLTRRADFGEVSSQPGTTRHIEALLLKAGPQTLRFLDTPGLEDAPAPDDLVIGEGKGRVFIDPVSLDLLAGAELDWAEALIGAHFAINNPQASSGCGCGTSFAIG